MYILQVNSAVDFANRGPFVANNSLVVPAAAAVQSDGFLREVNSDVLKIEVILELKMLTNLFKKNWGKWRTIYLLDYDNWSPIGENCDFGGSGTGKAIGGPDCQFESVLSGKEPFEFESLGEISVVDVEGPSGEGVSVGEAEEFPRVFNNGAAVGDE